jgi:predicted dehydrogenase
MIADTVRLGHDVSVPQPQLVNLYGCTIGDGSKVGAFVEVQRGATIGRNCKISSHTFICEGVTLEDGVFVGHGVIFTNDIYPRAVTADGQLQTDADWHVIETHVRAGASIGSNATIVAGVTIGRDQGRPTAHHRGWSARKGDPTRSHAWRGRARDGDPRNTYNRREQSMIRIGVIGYGYWGPNLVRNFAEVRDCQVAAVSDTRLERRALVQARYPAVRTTADYRDLLTDPNIDAVAIATPVSTHFPLALEALRAGKHVWVEKPMTTTSEEAMRLIDEAARCHRVLHVDHTFVYTGAVRKIRELVASEAIGRIYYYDSVRVNLGLFQRDVNVIWDLAVHDLSIMNYVMPIQPCAVSVTGVGHVAGEPENVAYLTMFFEDSTIAHVHVNWLAPVKMRRTLIGGSSKMIVYDDLEPSEKIKVYDKGVRLGNREDAKYQMLVGYRTGDMWAPHLEITEALQVEAAHFLDCINHSRRSLTDGEAGLRVVRILEAATQSMALRGQVIELDLPQLKATA